jgi:3-methyladenine DNA glycosylase AlkD
MCDVSEVRKLLKTKANKKAKESYKKFIPTAKKIYGVYSKEFKEIVSKYKNCGFDFVEKLWEGKYLEEKILAAKILGKICNKNPELTIRLIKKFVKDIDNWAVCDVLATQGIRKIAKQKQKELFEISRKLVKSRDSWKRRFGVVLLINYKKDKTLAKDIAKIIKPLKNEKEYYVKKAIDWLKR